ncbi:MAG: hypothetical protein CVT66_02530 [Actinobacteria bacterium HGW-Actinobacteria-6]|nr:MAG: hypothetical protein CVT66_02530 [Actinobacteria bacterium HGW-Actinobacteria-6]
MRRSPYIRIAAACAAFVLAISPIATPAAQADVSPTAIPSFTITGAGNGHGIGLSQYGSQGYALKGWKYDAIVNHYFRDTTISPMKDVSVKVNLDITGSARSTWTVRAVDATLTVRAGTTTKYLPKNTDYVFTCSTSTMYVKTVGGSTVATFAAASVMVDPVGNALFQIKENSGPNLNSSYPSGYPYMRWRGKLDLSRKTGTSTMYARNWVGFQDYLYGVVPRESPASWNAEALKAQSVVARSYAKQKVDPDDDGDVDSYLMCTTADQVYGGHSRLSQDKVVMHEDSRSNAAVDATKLLVVKYGSKIVQTFFSSASGGHTANIEDSWSYASPQPYYVGVDDPYEALAGSPYESWTVKKTGLELAAALRASSTVSSELSNHGLAAVPGGSTVYVTGVSITRGDSGYPRWTYFRFSDPAKTTVKLSAYTVKVALGLKSPNFSFSGFPMSRIQGPNRYETAIAISQRAFTGTAPAVVVASGETYPDALVGSALAGAESGSVLLTMNGSLPSAVEAELKRLAPSRVYIMGSNATISDAVEARLRTVLSSATTTRIAGVDRYETARKTADIVYSLKTPTKAIVTNGYAWPDAASVSALAYAKSYPILFSKQNELGSQTTQYLSARKPATTLLIGSETVLSDGVNTAVEAATTKDAARLSGPNRYATAAAVARFSITAAEGFTPSEVYITTGLNYPDALVGGVLAGKLRKPLLLTHPDVCPSGTAAFLNENKTAIGYLWIFGSSAAVSANGLDALDYVMNH